MRDNGICHICEKPVNDFLNPESFTAFAPKKFPDLPYDASGDHILEVAEGGTDALDNLKLAHKICNVKRSVEPERKRRKLRGQNA